MIEQLDLFATPASTVRAEGVWSERFDRKPWVPPVEGEIARIAGRWHRYDARPDERIWRDLDPWNQKGIHDRDDAPAQA